MGKRLINWVIGAGLWLSCYSAAWAQADSLVRQADRLLSWKAYGRAIDMYSQILTEQSNQLTAAQKVFIQGQLAFAYQQVGDGVKAERFYREAITNETGENPRQTLQYAQTLAANGKFQEAQQQYERYLKLKEKIPAHPPLSAPPGAAASAKTSQGPARYRLDLLAINSAGEEFSPAFYQDGLVYVAGKKGGASTGTSGGRGGSGYLDLFYVPNRNNLRVNSTLNADGTVTKASADRTRPERRVGDDEYTRPTANDSPTVPDYTASINITEGLGYGARPLNTGQRLSQALNTKYHEGPATFSRDGARIIFTRNSYNEGRTSKSADGITKLKLYTARQQNGTWTSVNELPFNNDDYSVGHPTLSRDEELLYFASDMPGGFGGTDLYVSRYQNGQWGRPVNLGGTINTKGNELFPFVDDTGNLYFSSDGHKGFGALDVFFATLANGVTVRAVEHLDAPINSPQDDFGLITDGNRRGGYFSSNRQAGNDDIYRFVRESSLYGCRDLTVRIYDTESNQPVDSVSVRVRAKGEGRADQVLVTDGNGVIRLCLENDDEFTFQASRDGYITGTAGFTTRSLTDDQPSRLEIGLLKPLVPVDTLANEPDGTGTLTSSRIRGVVISERDRRPIEGVSVRLRNECDGSQRVVVTGSDGRYSFDLAEGCDYILVASKAEFGTNTNRIKRLPKKAVPKELSADLRMLSVGDVVTIDNIYYDLDQSSLRPDAARELEKIVATMRKYPSLIVEIRSHTDSRGDAARNKVLSLQRARAVANYLASKGISRRRTAAVGMGESQLVNNCVDGVICTDAEHQRNRRTEFRVVEIK